jgi:multicomponent Na+:H+ antiporter subunit E
VLLRCLLLGLLMLAQILRANVVLAGLVCHRRPPIRTGMVIVPTKLRTEGGVAAVGLLTSLVVDNQIVDIDRNRHELLYHAVLVPDPSRSVYEQVNGPVERQLLHLEGQ